MCDLPTPSLTESQLSDTRHIYKAPCRVVTPHHCLTHLEDTMYNWVFCAISLIAILAFSRLSWVGTLEAVGLHQQIGEQGQCDQPQIRRSSNSRGSPSNDLPFVLVNILNENSRRWSRMTGAWPWLLQQRMAGAHYRCPWAGPCCRR